MLGEAMDSALTENAIVSSAVGMEAEESRRDMCLSSVSASIWSPDFEI